MNSLLPIFNDDDFVPHAYLDALFQQLNRNNEQIDLTSMKDLNNLQSVTLTLLNQLDFLTKEVTTELEENIKNLENTNSIISYSYSNSNFGNIDSNLKPTSRLEYYIDSLSIGINTLNQEIATINNSKSLQKPKNNLKINELLTLSKSKENLKKVLKALNTINSIIDIAKTLDETSTVKTAPTSINKDEEIIKIIRPNEFQLSINVLKETIIDQFNNKLNNESKDLIDYEFLKKINDLIKISEIFKNFNKFYTIYINFINFLKIEKKNYLNSKNSDINDELFKEVLK